MPTARCLKPRRFGLARRHLRAQTTVEFSLIVIPFFAILFALIDYAQIYFYDNALQNAMREASRFATAGRIIALTRADGSIVYETNNGVVTPTAVADGSHTEASRNACIRWWFLSNCVIRVPIASITVVSASVLPGQPPSLQTNNGVLQLVSGFTVSTNSITLAVSTNAVPAVRGPGAAEDYEQITVTYPVSTITPLMNYLGGFSHQGSNTYPLRVSAIVKNEPALLNFSHTNIYSDEP